MWFRHSGIKNMILLLAVCLMQQVNAKKYNHFLNYNTGNGLLSNTVYDIMMSKEGLMWIGTDNGIRVFNGIAFENYGFDEGVADDENFFFTEDNAGRIWIGNLNGKINYYEGKQFKTVRLPAYFSNYLFSYFQRIAVFDSVTLLQYNYASRFYAFKNNRFHLLPAKKPMLNDAIRYQKIQKIAYVSENKYRLFYHNRIVDIDSNGETTAVTTTPITRYLFANRSEYVCHIDSGKNHYTLFINDEVIENAPPVFHHISKVYTDSTYILIGTGSGLYVVNKTTGKRSWMFEPCYISGIYTDPEKNYWVSTLSNGIFKLPRQFETLQFIESDYHNIQSVYHYKNAKVILTKDELIISNLQNSITYRNKLENIFEIKDPRFPFCLHGNVLALLQRDVLVQFNIDDHSITRATQGFDCGSKTLVYFNGSYFSNRILTVHRMDITAQNTLQEPVVFGYDRRIFDMVNYKDSMLIICTNDSTFYFDKEYKTHRMQKLDNYAIRKMCIHNDHLVAITQNNAVILTGLNNNKDKVYTIPREKNEIFKSLQSDSASGIILYTNLDIKKLSVSSLNDSLIVRTERLKDIYKANQPDYICRANRQYFIHGSNGFLIVDTAEVFSSISKAHLNFDNFRIDDSLYYSGNISLPYKPNTNVTINFSRVNFSSRIVNYEYAIVSKQDEFPNWNPMPGNSIRMLNFGSGDYKIHLRETGESTLLSTYSLSIARPFWLRHWFIVMAVCIGILLILGIMLIIASVRKKKQEREIRLLKSEFKALNALMNPHFIFNSLNSLQNIVYKSDYDSAVEYIQVFSSLIRQNFINSKNEVIALSAEVTLVEKYLFIEKLRFKNRLEYHISIDEEADLETIFVPPLLLQPVVENSVKYGLNNDPTHTCKLNMSIVQAGGQLSIIIRDNSGGIDPSDLTKKYSTALQNIQERIQYLNKIYRSNIEFKYRNILDSAQQALGLEVQILIK